MATDDLDDTRVLNALGRLLAAGEPFTALPLVDPATKLFPSATMDVLDGRYPSAAEVSDLEASVTTQAETLTSHGADIDGLTTDVGALETLTTSGRLSTSQLSNTFVAVPSGGTTDQALVKKGDGSIGWGSPAGGGGQNIRLDAFAAGQRLRQTLRGNESETAVGVTTSTATNRDVTSALSIGTVTIATTGNLLTTSVAHGLAVDDAVSLGTITGTTGLTAGDVLFVKTVPTSTTLTLATSVGGSTKTISGDGTAVALYRRERAYNRQAAIVNPNIRVSDTRPVQSAATSPRWEYIAADPTIITYAPGTGTYTGLRVEVEYAGSAIGILIRNTSGMRGQVFVDGRFVSDVNNAGFVTDGITANSVGRYMLAFNSARRRTITIEFDGLTEFAGFDIQPAYPLIFPTSTTKGPRVLIVGDSVTEGTGAGNSRPYTRWVARLMGWRDVWKVGSGSTGYVNDGTRLALIDRYANDIIAQAPNVCIIAMGLNDNALTLSDVYAAAATIWDAVRTSLPNCELIIVGPWPNGTAAAGGAYLPALVTMDAQLASMAATRGIRYISPISEGWQYTLADGTHPDPAGHDYIAWRLAGHLSVPYIAT